MPRHDLPSSTLILLPERLDDPAARALGPGLRAMAKDTQYRHIRLDASALRHLSSRGLGLLAAVRLLVEARDGTVVAVECSAPIERALATVRMRTLPRAARGDEDSTPDPGDWIPWWTSAAANA